MSGQDPSLHLEIFIHADLQDTYINTHINVHMYMCVYIYIYICTDIK